MKKLINFIKRKNDQEKNIDVPIRTSDELFRSGNILKATDAELEGAIVEIANQNDQSQIIQSRNIIRGLVVNNIQSQRHTDKIDQRNTILTIVIIILTAINIYIAVQQTNYVELGSRSDRILQMEAIRRAVILCEQSPDLQDSGLKNMSNGNPAPCSEVLRLYK